MVNLVVASRGDGMVTLGFATYQLLLRLDSSYRSTLNTNMEHFADPSFLATVDCSDYTKCRQVIT